MARLLVFRNLAGDVVRVDVTKVVGVRPNQANGSMTIIRFRSGRMLNVVGKHGKVKARILANRQMERERIQAELKKKLKNAGELSDKFLRSYLEIKGGL